MKIKRAKSFRKQYRAYDRRGYDMQLLDDAILDMWHRITKGLQNKATMP